MQSKTSWNEWVDEDTLIFEIATEYESSRLRNHLEDIFKELASGNDFADYEAIERWLNQYCKPKVASALVENFLSIVSQDDATRMKGLVLPDFVLSMMAIILEPLPQKISALHKARRQLAFLYFDNGLGYLQKASWVCLFNSTRGATPSVLCGRVDKEREHMESYWELNGASGMTYAMYYQAVSTGPMPEPNKLFEWPQVARTFAHRHPTLIVDRNNLLSWRVAENAGMLMAEVAGAFLKTAMDTAGVKSWNKMLLRGASQTDCTTAAVDSGLTESPMEVDMTEPTMQHPQETEAPSVQETSASTEEQLSSEVKDRCGSASSDIFSPGTAQMMQEEKTVLPVSEVPANDDVDDNAKENVEMANDGLPEQQTATRPCSNTLSCANSLETTPIARQVSSTRTAELFRKYVLAFVNGKTRFDFVEDDVMDLLICGLASIKNDRAFHNIQLEEGEKVCVVGRIDGQVDVLRHVLDEQIPQLGGDNKSIPKGTLDGMYLIFSGNHFSVTSASAASSLTILLVLLALSIVFPTRIRLLKGGNEMSEQLFEELSNHEHVYNGAMDFVQSLPAACTVSSNHDRSPFGLIYGGVLTDGVASLFVHESKVLSDISIRELFDYTRARRVTNTSPVTYSGSTHRQSPTRRQCCHNIVASYEESRGQKRKVVAALMRLRQSKESIRWVVSDGLLYKVKDLASENTFRMLCMINDGETMTVDRQPFVMSLKRSAELSESEVLDLFASRVTVPATPDARKPASLII